MLDFFRRRTFRQRLTFYFAIAFALHVALAALIATLFNARPAESVRKTVFVELREAPAIDVSKRSDVARNAEQASRVHSKSRSEARSALDSKPHLKSTPDSSSTARPALSADSKNQARPGHGRTTVAQPNRANSGSPSTSLGEPALDRRPTQPTLSARAESEIAAPGETKLGELAPSFQPDSADRGRHPGTGSLDDNAEPSFDDPRSYMLSSRTYDEGNSELGFLDALWKRINGRFIFDSLLAENGHFGAVYLEFEVDRQGRLILASLHGLSTDKILKVHAIRAILIPALSQPLAPNLWAKSENNISLKAQFRFILSDTEKSLYDDDPQRIAGHAFSFRRFTSQPQLIKLVPGFVTLDLMAAYEKWEQYLKDKENRRAQYDPFALYRVDSFYN